MAEATAPRKSGFWSTLFWAIVLFPIWYWGVQCLHYEALSLKQDIQIGDAITDTRTSDREGDDI